jgi:hypothetical protein
MRLHEIAEQPSKLDKIKAFEDWACARLKIKNRPQLEYSDDKAIVDKRRTFGTARSDGTIWVYVGDRNTADALRTICHELVHHKQFEHGLASDDMNEEQRQSIEDVANAMAGRMLRDYGKQHVEIYEGKHGSLSQDVASSLPPTYIIPELQNQNPYMQYRFMVAMAGAKGKKQRAEDGVPKIDPESIWGQNEIVIGQDPHIDEYIDDALAEIGLSGKRLISSKKSKETSDTGTKSAVIPFKGYPR